MFSQPRINDIASLYQGNPGALQQRIQKEQQAKPGLPPDLQKLLALQIITSEQDAMKRNQALQQLQQTGQQPTVAENVQQQAKQVLQARMLQEQQKQQGLQALMQQAQPTQIPEGVPQPESQPEAQGLDQLPSNMGEFAGGGIIAFNGEEDSEVPKPKRQYTLQEQGKDWVERKLAAEAEQEKAARRSEESAARIPGESRQAPQGGERIESSEFGRNILNTLASLPGAGAARAFTGGARGLVAALAGLIGGDKANAPEAPRQAPAAPTNFADQVPAAEMAGFDRATADYMAQRAAPPAPPAAPRAEAPPRPAAPRPPVAPAAPAAAAPQPGASISPEIRKAYEQALRASLATDPEAMRKQEAERFRTEVGERPTASLETLAQEIAAQRQKIAGRADPLTDFLQGIAQSPRGERWMFSGARGADYANKQQAAREAQLLDLMKQQMEVQGKVEESKYGFKEKLFTVGNAAYQAAYESKRKALEAAGLDVREADRLAKEYAQIASTEAINAANRKSQEKIAGMPARVSPNEERYINEWLKRNPGKSFVDAYEAFKMSGTGLKGEMTLDQARDNVRKDLDNPMIANKMQQDAAAALKQRGISNPTSLQIMDYLVEQQMKGSKRATGVTGSATLPPGFKLD